MRDARKIVLIGILVSALLAILKITVGWFANSASLRADGFESAADVLSGGLVYIGLSLAAVPPDENHPYGHGRIETLTGLLLGFMLVLAGGVIAWHGVMGSAPAVPPRAYAIWPLILSVVLKAGLMAGKFHQGKKVGSSSLRADAANDAIDMLSGLVALVAVGLTLLYPDRFARADHYGAFAVGLLVIATGVRVIQEASLHLMDTMPDDEAMRSIRRVAMTVPDVKGVEKCFARKTGFQYHVDLHLEVDGNISVRLSHDIAEQVRDKVKHDLPWVADVLVHVEPWPDLKSHANATSTGTF